jgi:hypothetical protein
VLESVVDKPGLGPIEPALMELATPSEQGAVSGKRARVAARRSRGTVEES